MQKSQLIDPCIVKSCSVPVLISEKGWSPGPEHVELGTNKEIIYSFKMFSQQHRLIFHVKVTLTKFWSMTSLMRKEAKTAKNKEKTKVTFFRCILFAYFILFIYLLSHTI